MKRVPALLAALALPLAAALVVRWAVMGGSSGLFGRSVARGPGRRRSVALTFDDGPTPATRELARYLASHDVVATFFVCGLNAARHPEIVRELAAAGHELGNHTWSHPRLCPRLGWRLNLLSPRTVFHQIESTQAVLRNSEVPAPVLFRAPYGLRWWGLRHAQRVFRLLHVRWTVIGHDWEWDAARVARSVLRTARPGAIVCLHDGRDTRPNPDVSVTLEAVRAIVPELKRQGYRFETVSALLRSDSETVTPR